uniref:T-cell receptor gamma, type unspecified n=1 Tax=Cyprinus carpio carpio TaxID=630221 RepID=A0A9J7XHY0_CYPCA
MLINLCTVVLIMIHGVESVSLNQTQKVLVKQKGKSVSFTCEVKGLASGGFVHWYHKKDGETFKRILYISESGTATTEATGFTAEKKGKSYGIKLNTIRDEQAGMYYCASWEGSHNKKVFGSGTRLYVTGPGNTVESPKVSGYLPSKKYSDKHGKQTMLCHASGTVPYLVKFTWAKKSETEEWTAVPKEDVVEQSYKDKKIVTSMMIVDKNTAENNSYQCTVTIDGITENPQILEMKREDIKTAKGPSPTCPPDSEETMQISGDSEQISSLYVFVYAYGVMIMKNGLYFCVVSIFLLKRKAGRKKDESS